MGSPIATAAAVGALGYVAHHVTRTPPTTELSGLDATWLLIDNDPTNRIIVNAVMTFDTVLSNEQIEQTLKERLLKHPRFRMRAVVGNSTERPSLLDTQKLDFLVSTKWEPCTVDMKKHVFRVTLPATVPDAALPKGYKKPESVVANRQYPTKPQKIFGRTDAEIEFDQNLLDYISQVASLPLPLDLPLWQIHVLDNYGPGCALVFRIHHCIADGVGLLKLLLSLTEATPPKNQPGHPDSNESPSSVAKIKARRHNDSVGTTSAILTKVLTLLQWPFLGILALLRLIFMRPDPPTPFNGKVGIPKTAVWSAPINLETVKALSKKMDATVNDVIIGIASGALRNYLIKVGSKVDGLSIRSVVPFNLQPLDSRPDLKNEFSLLYVPLPLSEGEPTKRIQKISQVMNSLKNGVVPAVHLLAMQIFAKLFPLGLVRIIFRYYSQMATIIMSNVPGPTVPLYFAGHRIKQVIAWVPQSGTVGLGISIISYAGYFRIGFLADTGLVNDPQYIVNEIENEFDQLFKKFHIQVGPPPSTST
eukprot:TRINITY_DN11727_c0_g1_i2.p1 TRINITY_DN11727_c0_g1~~TRINITY_DN11727_c0_g1_i2.p1  ORF type:complete len:533 (+),score=96.05 TRINITY_DN11727_c0_g1_i2:75-1673(+)